MTPERVKELLEKYQSNRARLKHLHVEIAELQRAIEHEQRHALGDQAIRAQQYSGMPHTNAVNKAVEDAAIRFADGYQTPLVKQWRQDLDALQQEAVTLETAVGYVDVWLEALSDHERMVMLNHHPIGTMSWRELSAASPRLFGYFVSESGLRKIKERATAKINRIAR